MPAPAFARNDGQTGEVAAPRRTAAVVAFALAAAMGLTACGETAGPSTPGDSAGDVVSVHDGDTFRIELDNGKEERVRIVGINAPELARDNRPAQCYGEESAEHLRDMINGKRVQISFDDSQGQRDQYDRLLAYISVDGTDVGEQMIRDGAASYFIYQKDKPFSRADQYRDAQRDAKRADRGLWSESTCDGRY